MIVQKNINLAQKTTFHIGGIAKNFYVPESLEDMSMLIHDLKGEEFYILSGGSNLLINDQKFFNSVVYTGKFSMEMQYLDDGLFYIGASNRIQKVIAFVNNFEYGGFEELIGLPALFGGVIYMNAGIGGKGNQLFNIADFISRVKCMERETGKIVWINKEDCHFSYRSSLFQDNHFIILGGEIQLEKQPLELSKLKIAMRKEFIKNHQDWGKGCFGSCFSASSGKLLRLTSIISKFYPGGVKQSSHNKNWLVNDGTGTYRDTLRIIKTAKILHMLFHKEIQNEVIIWD